MESRRSVFRDKDYVPLCPKCRLPMEQALTQRSLRKLAVCLNCFIIEEWRLALLRD